MQKAITFFLRVRVPSSSLEDWSRGNTASFSSEEPDEVDDEPLKDFVKSILMMLPTNKTG